MKVSTFFVTFLTLSASLAIAHPGHDSGILHLHLGTPGIGNSLDLRLAFAALILGLVYQAVRAFKSR